MSVITPDDRLLHAHKRNALVRLIEKRERQHSLGVLLPMHMPYYLPKKGTLPEWVALHSKSVKGNSYLPRNLVLRYSRGLYYWHYDEAPNKGAARRVARKHNRRWKQIGKMSRQKKCG